MRHTELVVEEAAHFILAGKQREIQERARVPISPSNRSHFFNVSSPDNSAMGWRTNIYT
jgi:hypothetical protein